MNHRNFRLCFTAYIIVIYAVDSAARHSIIFGLTATIEQTGGPCSLYLQGRRPGHARTLKEAGGNQSSCLTHSFTLKREAIHSPEMSVDIYRITLRYNPEVRILHSHRCENLKYNSA
jgi:hypothetical protein